MPSPIRQDHARWKRLKPLQIHLNPLLKGLNLFTTFHLPGRGITSPFHTIYIYIYVHVHVNNNEFQKQILWVILGWFFQKKTPRGLRIIYQTTRQKTQNCFPFFFFGTSKKFGIAKRSVAWRLQGRIHGSKSLTPGSPFRISAHRSSFPPCGENQFRSFDPRPRGR